MKRTLGVFGGTFDPIHVGHLIAAEAARDALNLDRVRFLPSGRPPHKSARTVASDTHRLAMVRLALENRPGFEVDDRELQAGVSPYTFDTLQAIAREVPDSEITLLMGMDWVDHFHTWYRAQELLDEFTVAVLSRPRLEGGDSSSAPKKEDLFRHVETPLVALSSTDIRRRIAESGSVGFMVPQAVEDYILTEGLYR